MLSTERVPGRPPVERMSAEGIFGINALKSSLDLMEFIDREQPRTAVVIEDGCIGLEMAENLLLRNMKVSLI